MILMGRGDYSSLSWDLAEKEGGLWLMFGGLNAKGIPSATLGDTQHCLDLLFPRRDFR